jgi:hypothetical protein
MKPQRRGREARTRGAPAKDMVNKRQNRVSMRVACAWPNTRRHNYARTHARARARKDLLGMPGMVPLYLHACP